MSINLFILNIYHLNSLATKIVNTMCFMCLKCPFYNKSSKGLNHFGKYIWGKGGGGGGGKSSLCTVKWHAMQFYFDMALVKQGAGLSN